MLLQEKDGTRVPSYIIVDNDSWQAEFPGSVRRCYMCLREGHPLWRCPARDRLPEDGPVTWSSEMGDEVDIACIRDRGAQVYRNVEVETTPPL